MRITEILSDSWGAFMDAVRIFFAIGAKKGASVLDNILIHIIISMVLAAVGATVVKFGDFYLSRDWHTMAGIGIGFLLVFRSNIAYSRFWEARGHVGGMIKGARCIAMISSHQMQVPRDMPDPALAEKCCQLLKEDIHRFLKLYFLLTVCQLNGRNYDTERSSGLLVGALTGEEVELLQQLPSARPIVILSWLSERVAWAHNRHFMDTSVHRLIMREVVTLVEVFNGATKILSTPLPFPYQQMCVWLVFLFCYSAPFAFASVFLAQNSTVIGLYARTVFASVGLTIAFLGINAIAVELEDPFGDDANDLPMAEFCTKLMKDLDVIFSAKVPKNAAQDAYAQLAALMPKDSTKGPRNPSRHVSRPIGLAATDLPNTKRAE